MNRRWICNDVWMDIFPCFDHAQLGLKLALLSPRFNALVDKHFDGKRELTIWRKIKIHKDIGPKPRIAVRYIDHSVIAFLRLNHQIFDKRGTNLEFWIPAAHTTDGQRIWDIFVREIWPIFASNIRHLGFTQGNHLDHLRRRTSPTILTDLDQLNSIESFDLLPEAIGGDFDGPNATISAGQALSKWLHSPRKDGQPKRLRCEDHNEQANTNWVNNFKEHFLRANAISSVSYEILFTVHAPSMEMMPFELVNEWTKEKLTLAKANELEDWTMKRCKIIGEAATVQQQKKNENWNNNCNNVLFWLFSANNCIGPLAPPLTEEEAGQSITKVPYSADK